MERRSAWGNLITVAEDVYGLNRVAHQDEGER